MPWGTPLRGAGAEQIIAVYYDDLVEGLAQRSCREQPRHAAPRTTVAVCTVGSRG